MRCDGVRLFANGYAANVGVLSALAGPDDVVISDELDHASIIDGCRLSRATIVVAKHRDVAAVERALVEYRGRRCFVVSESLFSMDGDLADVRALAELCKRHDAAFVLDEAHALGARGPEGRGVAAAAGIVPDVLVGTCGKALGSFGAFVATTRAVADWLWNRARPFVFSTGLPPMVTAATEAAIAIVRGSEGDDRRRVLSDHARRFRMRITSAGGAPDSAIAPLVIGDDREVMHWTGRLLEQRVFVQGIRPPTVPEGTARLRVSVSAGHRTEDIEQVADLLHDAVRR
jgi:8-amino-7-oxononanoate synthase